MEQTGCSETSAYKIQTPGNYPEESTKHSEHVESLKSWLHCYSQGAFAKLRKATIMLCHVCLSVYMSVRMEQLVFHWTDFHEV